MSWYRPVDVAWCQAEIAIKGVGPRCSLRGCGWAGAHAVLVQADGRILTAGSGVAGGVSVDFTVARYRADGSLDPTFSNDGRIVAGGRSCKFPRDLG